LEMGQMNADEENVFQLSYANRRTVKNYFSF